MNLETFLDFRDQRLVDLLYKEASLFEIEKEDLESAYQKITRRNKKYSFLSYIDKFIFFCRSCWSNLLFLLVYLAFLFFVAIFLGIVYYVIFKGYNHSFGSWLAQFGSGMLEMVCQLFGVTTEWLYELIFDANNVVVVNGASISVEWLSLQGIFGFFNILVFFNIFLFFKEWYKELRSKENEQEKIKLSLEESQNCLGISSDDDFKEIKRRFYQRYKKHKFESKKSRKDIEAYIVLFLEKDYLRQKRPLSFLEHSKVLFIMVKDALIYLILNLIYSAFLGMSITLVYTRLIYFVVENIPQFNKYAIMCEQFNTWAFNTVVQFYGEANYQQLITNSSLPPEQFKLLSEIGSIFVLFTVFFLIINMYKRWLKTVRRNYLRHVRHYYSPIVEEKTIEEGITMEEEKKDTENNIEE